MSGPDTAPAVSGADSWRTAMTIATVSAAVIALQIGLTRALSLASYHHFTYLVISVALLGFGASGTVLSAVRDRVRARARLWELAAACAFAASSAWSLRIATSLPLDIQYILYGARQMGLLTLYIVLLFVPFLAAGFFIGLVFATRAQRIGGLYGLNLVASGVGGIAGVALTVAIPSEQIPAVIGSCVALVTVIHATGTGLRGVSVPALIMAGAALAVAAGSLLFPAPLRIDRYKGESHALRLVEQGDATLVTERPGPEGRVAVYDAPSLHYTLFASPLAPLPPPEFGLFVDGDLSGAIFRIADSARADILDSLPQSLAFRLVAGPRVLILGETSGVNVWLALRYGAESVTVVQQNRAIVEAVDALGDAAGSVFALDPVEVVAVSPRLFLERTTQTFDLIQIAQAEGMPASSGGLASLSEDYLLTVEGMGLALERLAPGGLISVTRGLQSPPRDNIRLFTLLAEAIANRGGDPADRLLQARNYLAATTVATAQPLGASARERVLSAAATLNMDVDYFPGIAREDLTNRNQLAIRPARTPADGHGASDESVSPYFLAAIAAVGSPLERNSFAARWPYDIRPPTDNRPYFHRFVRLRSLPGYLETYGREWFRRIELGVVVVLATLAIVLVLSAAFIAVPAAIARGRLRSSRAAATGAGWTIAHFLLIGAGFMFLEMLFIQRLSRFLGSPVFATAAVLTTVLAVSGWGSVFQSRLPMPEWKRIAIGATAVAMLALLYQVALDPLLSIAVSVPLWARFAVSVVVLAPVSFFLGWQFPAGIARLSPRDAPLIPLAWAANGVASVVAAPAAVLIASGFGFPVVSVAAAAAYGMVALLSLAGKRRQ